MLKDREYVYTVYQEGSFSKAAQRLFISQPALSIAVRRVEEKVGLPLFDRQARPLRLTPAGEYYIACVEQVMQIEREMESHFSAMTGRKRGVVNVGGSAFFCNYVLPGIAEEFRELYPHCHLNLVESDTATIIELLKTGRLDFTVNVEQLDPGAFESCWIGREELVLAVPRGFAVNETLVDRRLCFDEICGAGELLERALPVRLSLFRDEDFLLLKQSNDSYRRVRAMCQREGFEPRAVMYLDQMLTAYNIACSGKGIAFVRASLTRYVEPTERLWFYKLDYPEVRREICLYSRRDKKHSAAAQAFLKYVRMKKEADPSGRGLIVPLAHGEIKKDPGKA